MLIYEEVIIIQTYEKINLNYLKELDKKISIINLTYDITFKSAFQRNKNLLKDYLNSFSFINLKQTSKIKFLNSELYKENKNEYHKIIDLYLTIDNKLFIDIELNKMPFEIVMERNNLYLNKPLSVVLCRICMTLHCSHRFTTYTQPHISCAPHLFLLRNACATSPHDCISPHARLPTPHFATF